MLFSSNDDDVQWCFCASDQISGDALHKNGSQRQEDAFVHWSAARYEERPSFCGQTGCQPVINRLSTARKPDVSFLHLFANEFLCSFFRRIVQDSCLRCPGRHKGRLSSWRTDPSASHPTLHRFTAPPCAAPPRPALGMSGFSRTCLA